MSRFGEAESIIIRVRWAQLRANTVLPRWSHTTEQTMGYAHDPSPPPKQPKNPPRFRVQARLRMIERYGLWFTTNAGECGALTSYETEIPITSYFSGERNSRQDPRQIAGGFWLAANCKNVVGSSSRSDQCVAGAAYEYLAYKGSTPPLGLFVELL